MILICRGNKTKEIKTAPSSEELSRLIADFVFEEAHSILMEIQVEKPELENVIKALNAVRIEALNPEDYDTIYGWIKIKEL